MGLIFCKCWRNSTNSVGVLQDKYLKVLVLGLTGSGKTDVAHALSNKPRLDYTATNGVQCYQIEIPHPACTLSITEIGGNAEMRKIWHHYYCKSMGLIYCFDMSANYIQLRTTFRLLRHTMTHPFMRGKPVLLVGTKSNCIDEGLQLYDIENAFHLDAMARYHASSIRLCCFAVRQTVYENKEIENTISASNFLSLYAGFKWLIYKLFQNYETFQKRITFDGNMKIWQERKEAILPNGCSTTARYKVLGRRRFLKLRRNRVSVLRPKTAPAVIFTIYETNNLPSNEITRNKS